MHKNALHNFYVLNLTNVFIIVCKVSLVQILQNLEVPRLVDGYALQIVCSDVIFCRVV